MLERMNQILKEWMHRDEDCIPGLWEEEMKKMKRCWSGSSLFLYHSGIYNEGSSLVITTTAFSIVMLMETKKSE